MADTVQPPANMEVRGAPEASAAVVDTLARYRNARSAALVDWIGDAVLVATRFGDSTQLHRVETPLGMRRQVTFGSEPVRSAAVNPHPSEPGFVFLKDIGRQRCGRAHFGWPVALYRRFLVAERRLARLHDDRAQWSRLGYPRPFLRP